MERKKKDPNKLKFGGCEKGKCTFYNDMVKFTIDTESIEPLDYCYAAQACCRDEYWCNYTILVCDGKVIFYLYTGYKEVIITLPASSCATAFHDAFYELMDFVFYTKMMDEMDGQIDREIDLKYFKERNLQNGSS